jgi:peptidyl-dipeptidase A
MALEQQELDENDLFQLLDRLKRLTAEPFLRMKAGVDRVLARRYGLDRWDSAPWLYADPFFQEAPPGAAEVDLDGVFAGQNLEALTRRTFEPLGLPVEPVLVRSDLFERPGKCQHAFCTHIDRRGDVRVLCNVRPNEYWMSTMLHEFSQRATSISTPACRFCCGPGPHQLHRAVAMLFGRLTRRPEWLERVAGLDPGEARRLQGELQKALTINQLIFVRWGLLFVHFERELYRNPDQDLNRLWWSMAADFQQVALPADRDRPDWASKIHLACFPVYYHNYLPGELTASRWKPLSGTFRRGAPRHLLVDEPEAGSVSGGGVPSRGPPAGDPAQATGNGSTRHLDQSAA